MDKQIDLILKVLLEPSKTKHWNYICTKYSDWEDTLLPIAKFIYSSSFYRLLTQINVFKPTTL